jgi:polyisoprenyl-phosphate glycosyltransferase
MDRPMDLISLILPVYNEEAVIPLLLPRLRDLLDQLPCKSEVIFVNDGSRDRSGELLAQAALDDDRIKVVEFSRNFGHQIAITAGTDIAAGDVVIIMDADLQDPPEVVLQMIEKYQQGFDVVYGQRIRRDGDSFFKKRTAKAFYWLMRKAVHKELPDDVGDFRLLSRQVADALRCLREQHRFVRGMVTWLGFRQTAVTFERLPRAAGETKYPLRKMVAFAWGAITSFSGLPLRIGLLVGVMLILLAVGYAGYAVFMVSFMKMTVPGWASLVCLTVGLSGMIIVMLGLIGDYVARIYEELKHRPLYIVRSLTNVDPNSLVIRSESVISELRAIKPLSVSASLTARNGPPQKNQVP